MRKVILSITATVGAFMFFMGVMAGVASMALAQEMPDPDVSNLLEDDRFQIGVFDLVVEATGEVEERFFFYNGVITENSSVYIQEAIDMYPDVKKIAFNSSGGLASEADELGAIFSDNEIQTWVPSGRFCLSACANAFIGGWNYDVDGVLGFHAAWISEPVIAQMNPSEVNALFGSGQYSGVQHAYYWMVNGFSIQLPAIINGYSSPDSFVVFLSEDELLEYYVRNDDNATAESTDQLARYLSFPVSTPPAVFGSVEMTAYLTEQITDLQENGTRRAKHVDTIYDWAELNMPQEEE